MIKTTMICDCCGKEFVTQYYHDGYIDHFVNFASHFDSLVNKSASEISYEIALHGNETRKGYSMEERFRCFEIYCNKNNKQDLAATVKKLIDEQIAHLEYLDKVRKSIEGLVENLDDADKEYLGLQYQAY